MSTDTPSFDCHRSVAFGVSLNAWAIRRAHIDNRLGGTGSNVETSCVGADSQNCLLAPMRVANLRLVFQEQLSHDVLPGILALFERTGRVGPDGGRAERSFFSQQ